MKIKIIMNNNALSGMCVTIDGIWIGYWIYWPLLHTTHKDKQLQRHR
jgi:hypothetical protein